MLKEDFNTFVTLEEELKVLQEHAYNLVGDIEKLRKPAAGNRKWMGFGGLKDTVRREIEAKEQEMEAMQKVFDKKMKTYEEMRRQVQDEITQRTVAAAIAGTSETFSVMRPLRLRKPAASFV